MKVGGIDYGAGVPWEIEVPDSAVVVEGPEPKRVLPRLEDPVEAVREAIAHPLGTEPLSSHLGRLGSTSKVTIGINDNQGVSALAIPAVLDAFRDAGVREENVQIVVAGGMHPKLRRTELFLSKVRPPVVPPYPSPFHILPPDVIDRFWPTIYDTSRIRSHDASDPEHLVTLGVTEFGDLVEVNDCLVESDLVIYLSGFGGRPIVWGGYLGGGVSIAVGFGSARSIMCHHNLRVIDRPDSYASDARKQSVRKRKEAVAAFIEEATGKKTFYVEAVLNARKEYAAIFAGEGTAVRSAIFDLADTERIVEVPQQFDVLVAGAPYWETPYDTCNNPGIGMVQLTKKVRQFVGDKPPLREGGVAILVTPCDGSIQESRPIDGELLELFERLGWNEERLSDYEDAYGHREDLLYKYRYEHAFHPYHEFLMFYESAYLRRLASRVIYAGAKNPRAAALVGATATATWGEAWQLACRTLGKSEPSVLVMPRVATTDSYLLKVKES